jgi:hypothetical protein
VDDYEYELNELNGPFEYKTWSILASNQKPFRFYRVIQTDRNACPGEDYSLCLSGFEVYGTLTEAKKKSTRDTEEEDDPSQNQNLWSQEDLTNRGVIEYMGGRKVAKVLVYSSGLSKGQERLFISKSMKEKFDLMTKKEPFSW